MILQKEECPNFKGDCVETIMILLCDEGERMSGVDGEVVSPYGVHEIHDVMMMKKENMGQK